MFLILLFFVVLLLFVEARRGTTFIPCRSRIVVVSVVVSVYDEVLFFLESTAHVVFHVVLPMLVSRVASFSNVCLFVLVL